MRNSCKMNPLPPVVREGMHPITDSLNRPLPQLASSIFCLYETYELILLLTKHPGSLNSTSLHSYFWQFRKEMISDFSYFEKY